MFCENKISLSFLKFVSFSRYLYVKNTCKTGKILDPKIRAQRWIRFSQYEICVGKLREVIVLWHVGNKNLREFYKMILQSLIITVLKWRLFIVKRQFRWLRAPWNFGLSCRKFAFGGLESILKPCFSTKTCVLSFLRGSSSRCFLGG